MKTFHYRDVKAEDAGHGSARLSVRWLITKEMGAENFAMRFFEMEPGGHSPLHSHDWEHEVFILEGEGVVVADGKEWKLKAGDVIFIPPNEKHNFQNNSKENLKFLCLVPYSST